jgi:hypothetical protein
MFTIFSGAGLYLESIWMRIGPTLHIVIRSEDTAQHRAPLFFPKCYEASSKWLGL